MDKFSKEEGLNQAIDQFWETVPRVWNMIRGHLRTLAAEQFDISVEQFHVLRLIRQGFTSVKDIADARQISCPAISQAADILVGKGLITRRQAVDDRRYVQLALTSTGEDLLNKLFRQNRTWMIEKMASINVDDLNRISEGLALIKSAFDLPSEKSLDKHAH